MMDLGVALSADSHQIHRVFAAAPLVGQVMHLKTFSRIVAPPAPLTFVPRHPQRPLANLHPMSAFEVLLIWHFAESFQPPLVPFSFLVHGKFFGGIRITTTLPPGPVRCHEGAEQDGQSGGQQGNGVCV
jgi:hypothetical protein